jgi:hypothetical protein
MISNLDYSTGSIVVFKKSHPSKTLTWTVMRTGIDIKLKSNEVNNLYIILPRIKFVRQVKQILKK